jgi:hypothetical protein
MRLGGLILCSLLVSGAIVRADSSPTPQFPRAVVTADNVSEAIRFEWEQRKVYDVDPKPGESWFSLEEGTSQVLITAPHATAHIREGKPIWADAGTGALAHMLHVLTNSTILYTTRRSPQDPNYYDDCDFKRALSDYLVKRKPVLVLDLHASSASRPYDIDFGTMHGASLLGQGNLLQQLAGFLRDADFEDFSQDYFAADKDQTDTKFVSARGIPCIQLEINEAKMTLFNDGILTRMSDAEIKQEITKSGKMEYSPVIVDSNGAHQFSQTLEALVRFVKAQGN